MIRIASFHLCPLYVKFCELLNHHIIYHGIPLQKINKSSKTFKIMIFFNVIFCNGVNIFGMISGYVGFYGHKYSNLLYLLITTFFYSIIVALIFKFFVSKLIIRDIYKFLFPLFITDYWYFNCYFLMYFFLPIINKGILEINKNEMTYFIINLFIIFSLVGETRYYFDRFKSKDIVSLRNGFSYSWLIILYIYGSFFGKFNFLEKKQNKYFFFFIFCFIIVVLSLLKTFLILNKYKKYRNNDNINIDYTSPSSVIISICFLILFSNLRIKNIYLLKCISFFSPLTFGVYLLHNHLLVRNILIYSHFSFLLKYNNFQMILVEIISSLFILLFCSILDYLRYIIFNILKVRQICQLIINRIEIIAHKIISLIN